MLYREICSILGKYLFALNAILLIPLGVSIYFEYFALPEQHPQPHATFAFVMTIGISSLLATSFLFIARKATHFFFRREALLLVVIIWFLSTFIGALPFYLSHTFDSMLDSCFEAMSGFTTTGATLMHPKAFDLITGKEIPIFQEISQLTNVSYTFWGTIEPVRDPATGAILFQGVEAVSKALLFWRSLMQWLGGMGIVVLFIAILPALGIGGKALFQSEVPGPDKQGLAPRIKESASLLWKIYLFLSISEVILLMVTNRDITFFEACVTTFSTISTGGFSLFNHSVGHFNNPATEWIITLFMMLGGINFALYFFIYQGKIYRIFQMELFLYLLILCSASLFLSGLIYGHPKGLLSGEGGVFSSWESIRYATFHYISAQTSTGFATSNYDHWPHAAQVILLTGMFIGGMSGSTGGGVKVVRIYIIFHLLKDKIASIFQPDYVRSFKVGNHEVSTEMQSTVLCFFIIVIACVNLGTFALTLDGVDPETALSTNACMLNNIGIAFRMGAPDQSFAFLSSFGKTLSIVWMALGRLEFFAVLVILLPNFWKHQ